VARASGLTILSKLAKLIGLIVVLGVLAAGFLVPYVGGAGLGAKAAADKFLNASCNLKEEPVQQKTTLLASDGKTVIASFFDQNRVVIPFAQMPKAAINALVSTEDKRFYSHHGVDIHGMMRAALHTSNGNTQGASTLTEQYVKQSNYYTAITNGDKAGALAAIDQNLNRKISDAKCALKIETENSKNQILEKYFNIAFFGENSYGIQTAAQTFFGLNASQLTVPQAALLVGLVKSPTELDPFTNPQGARARRDLVISNMADQGFITQADATKYKTSPIKLARQTPPARGCAFANPKIKNAGFFCDYAYDWLQTTGGIPVTRIDTGGYKIVTTLNVGLQNAGQTAIWTNTGPATTLDPKNPYLLAMPSVDPRSGAVTSMITDKHYGVRGKDPSYTENKLFTDAYAGSGSTYKYFTALTALKAGVTPDFRLTAPDPYHTKYCPPGTDPPPNGYHNAGNYNSTYPLKLALPLSSNTYFVAMEDQLFGCNLAPIVNTASALGMNSLTDPRYKDSLGRTVAQATVADKSATFTLGQRSTSVLELTGAFSALANDGVFCPPTPITKVLDSSGKSVPFKRVGCSRQFDPFVARTLVNIMTNDTNPSGTGGTATSYFGNWYGNGGSMVAAKTGTNNSCTPNASTGQCDDDGKNSALWFVGITPTLVSAAALVNPDKPTLAISNVPGVTATNNGQDTFGAAASVFWLNAFGPTLQNQHWTWPTVDSTPGGPVPVVSNMDVATAQSTLTQNGFKSVVLKFKCGSSVQLDNVAYYSPQIAVPGATISLCPSSGLAPTVAALPTKTPTKGATPGRTPGRGPTSPPSHRGH
jgi:membrane peptidoglycan carboxypeptidase